MLYMILFWMLLIVSASLYILLKGKTYREDIITGISFLAVAFLIVAIVTRDPIFTQFGVPVEFEWVVGLFISGLAAWRLYFNPMKERVVKVEKDIIHMKTDINYIKTDIGCIKRMMENTEKNMT